MVRKIFQMSPADAKWLRELAAELKCSEAQIIRTMIRNARGGKPRRLPLIDDWSWFTPATEKRPPPMSAERLPPPNRVRWSIPRRGKQQ